MKVVVFSWKALHNRIPTKDNLRIRNVLSPETSTICMWCGRVDESVVHLFLHCDLAMGVWWKVMRWWNFSFVTPLNLFVHWAVWNGVETRKKLKKVLRLVWHATVWVLWTARNNRIFNHEVRGTDDLVEEIKLLSWRWALHRLQLSPCLLYEWIWNPRECSIR